MKLRAGDGDRTRDVQGRKSLAVTPKRLLEGLLRILETGDLSTQQTIARTVEKTFRQKGYNNIFDAWKGEDRWAMDFVPGMQE